AACDQAAALPITETLCGGLDEACQLCGFGNFTWSNSSTFSCTRSQQPNGATITQWAEGVNQAVHEIAVFFAPPHHNYVDEFISLFLEEVLPQYRLNGLRDCRVAIFVPAKLQGDHALSYAEHRCIVIGYASSVSHRGIPPLVLKTSYEVIRNCIAPYL